MKRSTFTGSTVVYQYGTPHWADLDEEGSNQLRLANGLWNELVAIERRYDAAVKDTEGDIPELAEAEAAVTEAAVCVAELRERMKRERVKDRSTKVRTATAAELRLANANLKAAKEQRKTVREATKESRQAIRAEANTAKQQETGPEMYRTWTERGLGWGTYNDVRDRLETARKQIIRLRSQAEAAEFHPHRWNGEGTLAVQCQQMTGKPRRVEWEILGDHPKHKTLRLRIGRARGMGSHLLEIPFVYHRLLPCTPQYVTDVQVTRRMVAGKPRITITFSCRIPAVAPRTNGTSVAVRIRWKSERDGILVAQVSSSEPLPLVPEGLRPFIRMMGQRHADVVLPASVTFPLTRDDDIRSIRDRMLEELKPHVVSAMADESIRELVNGDPAKWRAPGRFASLTRRIPFEHPLHTIMEEWRQRDKHLWTYEANERDQTIARRRDAWRKVGAWLATDAQVIAISDTDYAEVKKRPANKEDTYEQRGGREQMQKASPGEFRLYVEQAARKHGIQIMHVERDDADGSGATGIEANEDCAD